MRFDVLSFALAVAAVLAPPPRGWCAAGETRADDASHAHATRPTVARPTRDHPLVVDREGRRVFLYAEVNRRYVTEPTRHGIASVHGSNGGKSVFRAFAGVMDVRRALVEVGARAGENVKPESPAGTVVEGDALDVRVEWGDQSRSLDDVIASSGELGGRPLAIRFGGNEAAQHRKHTGCILCLDSCAVGITSNAAVGSQSFDGGKVEFRARGDRLPADGAAVTIVLAAK